MTGAQTLDVSVVVPVNERPEPLAALFAEYSEPLSAAGLSFEFIFATIPTFTPMVEELRTLAAQGAPIRVLDFGHSVGEASMLKVAAGHCRGRVLVTVPAYRQVESTALIPLISRLEKADLAGAESLLARSLTLDPKDAVARYRYGRVLQAQKEDAEALAAFDATIRAARDCPAPIVAAAYLEAGRLHERFARTAEAIDHYRVASTLFGGGADTRAAATRALARLRAPK